MDAALPAAAVARPTRRLPAVGSRPGFAAVVCAALLTVALLVLVPRPLSPDVSGQLWIADRLRHGARLYVDISEINPPLWFWLAMPVDALASLTHARAEDVLIVAVGGLALTSLLATDRLLPDPSPTTRTVLLLYSAGVLLVMPLRDLGQREQLALFGALPYAALIAARREARAVPAWLAVAVGAGAAVGFAFKHYFVAAPLLLEVWLALGQRRTWRPWRPELLVLVGSALAYAVVIVHLTPAYFAESVPELTLAYVVDAEPAWRMLRPAQPVWLLLGYALWKTRAGEGLPAVAVALLIAAAGFGLGWAVQHKGWPYHSIPTTGLLAMALATTLATQRLRHASPLTVAALIAPLALAAIPTQWKPGARTDIAPALADLRAGDPVAIVSVEGPTAWPAAIGRGFRYPGRRPSFWMLPAVEAHPDNPRLAAFGRRVVSEAAADYRCLPPRRIVFAPRDGPLRFFLRSPDFVRLLARYRRVERAGDFDAFDLIDVTSVAGRACRRG